MSKPRSGPSMLWLIVPVLLVCGLIVLFFTPHPPGHPDLSGATGWINTPPLTPEAISGRPLALYFWSSTCERCLEGIDEVRTWSDIPGLQVVLVHSPEFAFERSNESAAYWVDALNLSWRVALDHEGALWANSSVNRPQDILYVFNASGDLVHFASRAVSGHEAALRALAENKAVSWPVVPPEYPKRIYMGAQTSVQGVRAYWRPYQSSEYVLPSETDTYRPYLVGRWYVGADFVRAESDGTVFLKLKDVSHLSAVMSASGAVAVFQDGKPLEGNRMGADVTLINGVSAAYSDIPRLYALAKDLPVETVIMLDVPAGFVLYRFTVE